MKKLTFLFLLISALAFGQKQEAIPAEVQTFSYSEGETSKSLMNKTEWFIALIPMMDINITNNVKADNGFVFTALQPTDNSEEFVSSDVTYQFLEKSYSASAQNFQVYHSVTKSFRPLDLKKDVDYLAFVRETFFNYWKETLKE